MHLSFLTSHNLLFFRFCKNSKKTTFSVFLSFFLVKSPKSQSLKLNISRTAWPILMILVSFCRILNGLSDEINLFWRCSSPLTILVFESNDAKARPWGQHHLQPLPPPGTFCCADAQRLGTHFGAKAWGMFTGQCDTCITLSLF